MEEILDFVARHCSFLWTRRFMIEGGGYIEDADAAFLDVVSGYEPGDSWFAPPPERPFSDEVGADPGRLRIGVAATPPIDVPVHADCVDASTFDIVVNTGVLGMAGAAGTICAALMVLPSLGQRPGVAA